MTNSLCPVAHGNHTAASTSPSISSPTAQSKKTSGTYQQKCPFAAGLQNLDRPSRYEDGLKVQSDRFKSITDIKSARSLLANAARYPSIDFRAPIGGNQSRYLPFVGNIQLFGMNTAMFTNGEKHQRIRVNIGTPWKHCIGQFGQAAIERNIEKTFQQLDKRMGQSSIQIDILNEMIKPLQIKVVCDLVFGADRVSDEGVQAIIDSSAGLSNILHKVSPEGTSVASDVVNNPVSIGTPVILQRLLGSGPFLNLTKQDYVRACQSATDLINIINRHIREDAPEDSLMGLMKSDMPGSVEEMDELVSLLVFFFLASVDTTSTFMANALKLIEDNPEQKALILSHPEKYVKPAIQESLRLIPSVRYLTRRDHSSDSTKVAVIDVQESNKGPQFGENPEQFDLKRHEAQQVPENLSFGWGKHHCLGKLLVLPHSEAFFSRLYQDYDLDLAEPMHFSPPKNRCPFQEVEGLEVRLAPRALNAAPMKSDGESIPPFEKRAQSPTALPR